MLGRVFLSLLCFLFVCVVLGLGYRFGRDFDRNYHDKQNEFQLTERRHRRFCVNSSAEEIHEIGYDEFCAQAPVMLNHSVLLEALGDTIDDWFDSVTVWGVLLVSMLLSMTLLLCCVLLCVAPRWSLRDSQFLPLTEQQLRKKRE